MTTERYSTILGLLLTVAAACALLGIVSSLPPARALPPRPEPEPTGTPTPVPKMSDVSVAGGYIELIVWFPSGWPWHETHWQDLWTTVQWRHPDGVWRDVEGWRGTLDGVAVKDDGAVVGSRMWWVDKVNLGEGSFRWVVTRSGESIPVATSDAFSLPSATSRTTTVDVTLMP